MIRINEHYRKLQSSYLFAEIKQRVDEYQKANPQTRVIKLGIGDVTRGLPGACIQAMHTAVDEMAEDETFRGYGPEQGYEFLRQAIADNDFQARGADIKPDEIFISDGAKCDTANFQELLSGESRVALPDPVYPVYLDTNVMAGRTGPEKDGRYQGITYLESTRENGYIPDLPPEAVDVIYLCFPNNPTGATISRTGLQKWVDYARDNKALILFDAAYECFIRDDSLPHSIFELPGAREVAVEFRSFSKTAGFTGTRCAYTVVPKDCRAWTADGDTVSLHDLWFRRQSTKFNGVSYPIQRAAEAVYSPEGQVQVRKLTDFYLTNAGMIRQAMTDLSFECVGGENSPYIWIYGGRSSREIFDMLLNQAGVVCTPGVGFGRCGENFIRISAFNSRENVEEALERIQKALA
ncbi:LL-diaminopimelate aminotransferase [Desulfovermiculus halophilus]|uniref:LL-diaminopimelate aminotransferase n=1 Tax=Desulfovermiculus halophilus TaxID=339722 RepID=UPI00048628A6|nr:LL-diaminopimelate aminotransferase [Desulfovermiculus halophilus]